MTKTTLLITRKTPSLEKDRVNCLIEIFKELRNAGIDCELQIDDDHIRLRFYEDYNGITVVKEP